MQRPGAQRWLAHQRDWLQCDAEVEGVVGRGWSWKCCPLGKRFSFILRVVGSTGTCPGVYILDLAFRKKSLFAGGESSRGGPLCRVHLMK